MIMVGEAVVGDVVRLDDDRQAHRVMQVLRTADDRVLLRLQPVGLAVEPTSRHLPSDTVLERLATATDS
jgi:hypothetical protein